MITIGFIIILLITINMTNKKNEAKASDDVLEFTKGDSFIIFLLFLSSIVVNNIAKRLHLSGKDFWLCFGISMFVYTCSLILVNNNREKFIKKKHDQIINVYQALADILGKVDIEYENTPFILEECKKTKKINKILLDTSNQSLRVNENTITLATYSMNKFFSDFQWMSEQNHQKRELIFKGLPKPPKIAKYPGSDYRPTGWIPLGVSGLGEVGWNMSGESEKKLGVSSYIGEDGKPIENFISPSAPQAMCLGSPLSLDTIIPTTEGYKTMKNIQIGDYVFDIYGRKSKVLGLSSVHMSNEMFKMILKNTDTGDTIIVKSDGIHKFPIKIFAEEYHRLEPMNSLFLLKDLQDICIYGQNNEKFIVQDIYQIENEFVRCILVDSETHLFLITDEINDKWKGGDYYPFKACATSNTGGGKSIWVEQEIKDI